MEKPSITTEFYGLMIATKVGLSLRPLERTLINIVFFFENSGETPFSAKRLK